MNIKRGIIIKGVGGAYEICLENHEVVGAKPRGLFRNTGTVPTVGDQVEIEESGDPDFPYMITEIYPRKNILVRPPISNLDTLVITISAKMPKPDYTLIDKLLILCGKNKIHPVIWITKIDLAPKKADEIGIMYGKAGFTIVMSSMEMDIKSIFPEELYAKKIISFAGQSGVGKSTLCNALVQSEFMEVGAVSKKLKRGKHTTRHVELIPFGNGYIADTPGFSSLRLPDLGIETNDVILGYPELAQIQDQCRFQDCKHIGEEGCAEDQAEIDEQRFNRYREFVSQLQQMKKYT